MSLVVVDFGVKVSVNVQEAACCGLVRCRSGLECSHDPTEELAVAVV